MGVAAMAGVALAAVASWSPWGAGPAAASRAAEAVPPEPETILHRALDLMGGEARLREIATVRMDFTTQWQRTGFRDLPATDRPSFEDHVDVRDYRIPAWRNTRLFGSRTIVNVIRDSVATTDFGDGPRPLSVAYVDERRELFTYTPDRLLLALADAPDLRRGADTTLAGEPHHRLRATLRGRFDGEVFFHAVSGAPSLLRFTSSHRNDYGLVPWGEMLVEVWYAGWRSFGDVSIPTQWDVYRVGRPYRRFTVRAATFDPELAADSFRISPELRARWRGEAGMPMHEERPMPEMTRPGPGLLQIGGFGYPLGAVQTGEGWIAVGAGQADYNFGVAVPAIEAEAGAPVTAVLAASATTANGGVVEAARRGVPIWTTPSAEAYVRHILAAGGVEGEVRVLRAPETLGTGSAALRLIPFSLPDAPESLLAYHPASGWLYVPDAVGPFGVGRARAEAERRGWEVRIIGTQRQLAPQESG